MVRFIAMMAAVILAGLPVGAQQATGSSESAPYVDAPVAQDAGAAKPPVTAQQSSVGEEYIYVLGAFCGAGASTSSAGTKPATGCGVGMTFIPLPIFFELGLMGPQANRSSLSGYISVNTSVPLMPIRSKYLPMAIVGYSRLFETGHSFDYGLALAMPRWGDPKKAGSTRIELRDYWTFANPAQHNVMLRVGWMGMESD
jgi:hypothetical protein